MWKGTVRMTGTELADEIERHRRPFPPQVRERESSNLLARAATALRRPATVYSHLTQEQFDQLQADAISWRTRQPSSDQVLVPREPTEAMLVAADDARGAGADFAEIYRTMLAAAEAEKKGP